MKLFVVLSCIALVAARPGYNYDRPISGGFNQGFNGGGGAINVQSVGSGFGSGFGGGFQQHGGGFQSGGSARVVNAGPVLVGGGGSGGLGYSSGPANTFIGNGFANLPLNQGPAIGGGFHGASIQGQGQGFSGGNNFGASGFGGAISSGSGFAQGGFGGQSGGSGFAQGGFGGQSSGQGFGQAVGGGFGQSVGPSVGPTVVQKHIYVHVPPPEAESANSQQQFLPAAPAQKHYKIIFIKTPNVAQNNQAQLIAQAAAQTQEKTLIYVLVKKPEDNNINNIILQNTPPFQPTKPEVYFIKYKSRNGGAAGGIGGGIGGGVGGGIVSGNGGIIHEEGVADIGASGSGNLISAGGLIGGGGHGSGIGSGSGQVDIRQSGAGSSSGIIAPITDYLPPKPHTDYGVPHKK